MERQEVEFGTFESQPVTQAPLGFLLFVVFPLLFLNVFLFCIVRFSQPTAFNKQTRKEDKRTDMLYQVTIFDPL